MSLAAADIAFAKELFADIPNLTTRRMFGGLGLYTGDTIFAVMRSDAQILIKAQPGPFAQKMADLGSAIWSHTRKNGKTSTMPYWTLPETALDDPEEATALAQEAILALDS